MLYTDTCFVQIANMLRCLYYIILCMTFPKFPLALLTCGFPYHLDIWLAFKNRKTDTLCISVTNISHVLHVFDQMFLFCDFEDHVLTWFSCPTLHCIEDDHEKLTLEHCMIVLPCILTLPIWLFHVPY